MRREFNETGVCVRNMHYMVDTTPQMDEIFKRFIEKGKYFTITGGRQFGKTTTISLLAELLEKKDEYLLIETSFEGIGDNIFRNEETFSKGFLMNLYSATRLENKKLANIFEDASKKTNNFETLSGFITDFVVEQQKKVVLVIDEVDKSSNNQLFLSFLGLLRDKYLNRNRGKDYTFYSVILAGVHDIKTIKLKIQEGDEEKLNSPWNIAATFDIDLSFHPAQIVTLLDDYLSEHLNINIPKQQVADRIYYYTSGYPFLVSKICKIIAEEFISKRDNKNWTIEDVEKAYKIIVYEGFTTTLFDSIAKNLINNIKLYKFIYEIIIDNEAKSYTINNPNVLLATAYGIIKDDNGCKIHNHIFEQRIYDLMLSIHRDNSTIKSLSRTSDFYIGNDIDLEHILLRFQIFFKENYSHTDKNFLEREGRLVFLSYLQPIINSKGYIFKEPVVGEERRMDLAIIHNEKRYIVELKIWHGEKYHQEGLKQLNNYLNICSLKKGYLLIFNFNKKKQFKDEIIKFDDKEIFTVWV